MKRTYVKSGALYLPETLKFRIAPAILTSGRRPSGGGGGGGCTPTYTGGTGNRSGSITVTAATGLFNNVAGAQNMVAGNATGTYWFNGHTLDGSTYWVKFDFGTGTILTEVIWKQDTSTGQGVWQWNGSNDDSSYTAVGATFTLGGATSQTQTVLNGNAISYRYYKLLGISGSTSSTPFQLGMDDQRCL